MKRFIYVLMMVMIFGLMMNSNVFAVGLFDDWGRKVEITIDSSKVSSTLSNFPVLITEANLPSEMFDADGFYPALDGGGDIRFSSDSAGENILNLEVVNFVTDNDPVNGNAELWVNIPSLSSTTDTVIYCWYNKAGESQPSSSLNGGSEGVWNSDYKMVHHMDGATSNELIDSTSNGYNVNSADGSMSFNQVGEIKESVNFVPNSKLNLNVLPIGTSNFSVQLWVKTATLSESGMFIKIGASDGIGIGVGGARASDGNDGNTLFIIEEVRRWINTGTALGTNWNKVDVVYNSSGNPEIFLNGSSIFADTNGVLISPTAVMQIGGSNVNNENRYANSSIGEVRVLITSLSSAQVAVEFNNQNSPETFATAGTPLDVGAPPAPTTPAVIVGNIISHCGFPDLNANSKPETLNLGVDDAGVPTVMVVDVDTDTHHKSYQAFDAGWTPKQVFQIPDMSITADGIPDVVVQAKNNTGGQESVQIIDSVAGTLIKELPLK